jgi:DNA-binding protein H-NS
MVQHTGMIRIFKTICRTVIQISMAVSWFLLFIETLEAKIKLLEDQLEERNNDELDLQQRLSATLQEIEYFQTVSTLYTIAHNCRFII